MKNKFQLTIECDGAAFDPIDEEVSRILRTAATRVQAGIISGSVLDANGNRAGTFRFYQVRNK